jgi:hypothetical protein
MGLEGEGSGIFQYALLELSWKYERKLRKPSITTAGNSPSILTHYV